jgi:putative ABC transport system substrate-binding protein
MMHKILAVAVGPGKSQRPAVQPNVIQDGQLSRLRSIIQGMVQGLQALGHSPGASFDLDYAEAEPHLLRGLLRTAVKESKPDVIFTVASSARQAAQAVTKSIPIVFTVVSDPIEERAVKSTARPGTNATGVRTMLRHTAANCLELFKAMVPSLRKVYTLHQPGFPPAVRAMPRLRQAAKQLRIAFLPQVVRRRAEIADRLKALSQAGPAGKPQVGLLLVPDDLVVSEGYNVIQLAHSDGIPTFFPVVEFVNASAQSALGAYGVPGQASGEAAAAYVHKILQGTQPAHLPVKRAGSFEWRINNSIVAKTLNITIPGHILQAADQVY